MTVLAEKGAGVGFEIHDFLIKPVRPEDLLDALARLSLPADSQRSLLIVDDDVDASRLVQPALKTLDFQVTARFDGETGLAEAKEHPPSAVVLDLMMPGMDGFEFLHRFRMTPRGRATPVIVWTAKDLSEAERTRLQTSAHAIIQKGNGSTDELLAELGRCVPPSRSSHGR
jgi:CheY-like chemotaxis protein